MPLFSIITPVYNNEKYITKAVESVLQQEFTDFEYIIVDDGSTDQTPQVVDRIAEEDERVRVIHQKNQWIYASFNNGIREAVGKYIYILNSDDRMRDGMLAKMAQIVQQYEPDVIWTKVLVHKCDAEQQITAYDYENLDQTVERDVFWADKRECQKNWLFLTTRALNQNQANLYKRELMLKHPFRNDVYAADTLFNISIADDIQTAFVMKEAVYDFMEYDLPHMNASIGKYYPYLHTMFNDIYVGSKSLYKNWGLYDDDLKEYWSKRRLKDLTAEFAMMHHPNCKLSVDEKIEEVLHIFEDDVIRECAMETDRLEELESRILSGLRMILTQGILENTSPYFFLFELLEVLLCYEKTTADYDRMERAVNHPLNKKHLGKLFFAKIKREDCWDN